MSATSPHSTRPTVPGVRRPVVDGAPPRVVRAPAPRSSREVVLLPNVLIPGVTHAGASMLTADLGRHPQLCVSSDRGPGCFAPLRYGRAVDVDTHDYDRHFAGWSGQRYRLETCPDYLDGDRPMAESLDRRLPGLRVIVVLCDPAQRLWAGYADKLARRRLSRGITFDTFVDRCLTLRANGADRFEGNRHFRTLSSGFYVEHLPHWFDVFGDRLRVVFSENLLRDPVAGADALLDWLGLDPAEATPAGSAPEPADGGYPAPEPAAPNRWRWPVMQRSRRYTPAAPGTPAWLPRQSDRTRSHVRSLYAGANAELAALLRERGTTALPGWLSGAEG